LSWKVKKQLDTRSSNDFLGEVLLVARRISSDTTNSVEEGDSISQLLDSDPLFGNLKILSPKFFSSLSLKYGEVLQGSCLNKPFPSWKTSLNYFSININLIESSELEEMGSKFLDSESESMVGSREKVLSLGDFVGDSKRDLQLIEEGSSGGTTFIHPNPVGRVTNRSRE
jgi:hypothetical protein